MRGKRGLKPTIFHKKNRKGQFYLLAAIIIITILVGFVTVSNYSRRKTSVKLYDLGEELGIESQNVIDYGTYAQEDLDVLLGQFIESYVDYAGGGKNLYFLFGDFTSITVKAYQELEESVFVDGSELIMTNGKGEKMHTPSASKIAILIGDVEYQFDLTEEEKFYFVVSQEIEGEKHVVTG